jgi:hypothetical protein
VIREPGAHSWASYPVGSGGSYLDYAGAAMIIARAAKAGDGVVYQAREGQESWLMIGSGDAGPGGGPTAVLPAQLRQARTKPDRVPAAARVTNDVSRRR